MPERRRLVFVELQDVNADVDRLAAGHVTLGKWTLGQICNHLSGTMRLTARPASSPGEDSPALAGNRNAFFTSGNFPEGRTAPPFLDPQPDVDAMKEIATLKSAIERFLAAPGPFPGHPFLGPLSREEWLRFHCMHAAHHLSFAVPT